MDGFYATLARHYDALFLEEPAITGFLATGLRTGSRVLDLACGTGTYAAALAHRGHRVTGVDLAPEMIAAAAQPRPAGLRLLVGDMRALRSLAPGSFDLIYCIGNSLVHMPSHAAVRTLLSDAAQSLDRGGQLVVQIVNYDRALTELPPLSGPGVEMTRRYRPAPEPGRLLFHVTLTSGGTVLEQETSLLALGSAALQELLAGAGLKTIEHLGGYDRSPHTAGSFLTLVRAAGNA